MKMNGVLSLSNRELSYLRSCLSVMSEKLSSVALSMGKVQELEITSNDDLTDEEKQERVMLIQESTAREVASTISALDKSLLALEHFGSFSLKSPSLHVEFISYEEDGVKGWKYSIDLSSDVIAVYALAMELYVELYAKAMYCLVKDFPMDKMKRIVSLIGNLDFKAIKPE